MKKLLTAQHEIAITDTQLGDLRNRFQFLILLMTFFPILTSALFAESSSKLDANNQILNWGDVIMIMILNYLLLETLGKRIVWSVGKWVNVFIFANVLAFVPVIYIMSTYHDGPLATPVGWALFVSLIVLTNSCIVMLTLLSIHAVVVALRAIDKAIDKTLSRLFPTKSK